MLQIANSLILTTKMNNLKPKIVIFLK